MQSLMKLKWLGPFLMVFLVFAAVDWTALTSDAEARARGGGRAPSSFNRSAPQNTPAKQQPGSNQGSFGKGFMGGLLGAGIGALLFGSLFGNSGGGIGILPLLLLAGAGYFFYRRFIKKPTPAASGYGPPSPEGSVFAPNLTPQGGGYGQPMQDFSRPAGGPQQGLSDILRNDPGFDQNHFLEVASDVFFRIQAGWTRRDFSAIRHLLGNQLANEYDGYLRDLVAKGQINRLENISIRKTAIVDAGSDGQEDFVTVLFTANLLDYTVDEKSGAVLEGSTTEPVRFAEEWTWARPTGTDNWVLERVQEVNA